MIHVLRSAHSRVKQNEIFYRVIKLLVVFGCIYMIYPVVISASHPDGKLYSPFVMNHLNIIQWIRDMMLTAVQGIFSLADIETTRVGLFKIRMEEAGRGVNLNNACLGYGIMSFWIAFIVANDGKWQHKLKWVIGGLLVIITLNIIRVGVLLYAINHDWTSFTSIEQHTLFNIVLYIFLFLLIWYYTVKQKQVNKQHEADYSRP